MKGVKAAYKGSYVVYKLSSGTLVPHLLLNLL